MFACARNAFKQLLRKHRVLSNRLIIKDGFIGLIETERNEHTIHQIPPSLLREFNAHRGTHLANLSIANKQFS